MSEPTSQDVAVPEGSFFWRVGTFLVDRRNLLFAMMVLVVLGGLYYAQYVKIDNSLELWFLEDDPALKAYHDFKELYGNDEIILAMVDCGQDNGLFTQDFLNRLYAASHAMEDDSRLIRRVLSLGLSPHIGLENEMDLIVEDLMTASATSDADVEQIRRRFFDDPFKRKLLIDMRQRHAILLIEPEATTEMDARRPEVIATVEQQLQQWGFTFKLAGMGVMYNELNRLSLRDSLLFTSVSYLLILLVVFFLFRSWLYLIMVITVMVLGTAAFIGVYGFYRQNFNMVTVVLPTLMLILSISDVSFIYNYYVVNIDRVREDRRKGLIYVFANIISPCFFTSLTNFFGFISIVLSPMEVLRGFGLFAALATMAEYTISMIAAAFLLGLVSPAGKIEERRPFAGYVTRWVHLMPKHHRTVMVLLIISAVFGISGIFQLESDTYSMGFLQQTNSVRMQSDEIEGVYGNYLPLEIRLITEKEDGVKDPDFLSRLATAHEALEALPGFQRPASIADVMRRLNQVMSDGTPATYVVPDSDDKVAQLLMLYQSDPDNDLKYMVDPEFREARLTVRVPMVSAVSLHRLEQQAQTTLEKLFAGTTVKIQFGGYVPLYSRLINYITESQVSSFGTALLAIFGAMALLFRRFDAIWLGIIPNVYPIIMTLGMMGWIGIRLDVATVTIASIAIGVAVDDTIHELFLFYKPERRHLDPVDSICEVLIEEGPVVVATSLIYAVGFAALALASIKSVVYFGGLLAMTLIFGMICEISIMPALICQFKDYLDKGR